MRIILSPTKKMRTDNDDFAAETMPVFLPETEKILDTLQEMNAEDLQKLWKCNDSIASVNLQRLRTMDLHASLSPALFSYEGLAFKYLSPGSLSDDGLDYLRHELRIISGFYGSLRAFDGITPYRLEMQAGVSVAGSRDLYAYWGKKIAEDVCRDRDTVIDLASREYSRCVYEHLPEGVRVIEIIFAEDTGKKLVTKGTMAKMARGEMTRYIAENGIEEPAGLKDFSMHYRYAEEYSDREHMVFLYDKQERKEDW